MSKQLTKRGYSIPKSGPFDIETIQKELTVSPFQPKGYSFGPVPKYSLYQESESKLYLPKYYGLSKFGTPDLVKTTKGDEIDLAFKGNLRTEQAIPVEAMLNACRDPARMGGILNVFCGGGKTTMALYILAQLKRKALIIVHKDFLLEQWKERIQLFLPTARIGTIKAKVIDIANKDIVIGSLQSLSMKTYEPNIFDTFGTVIIDEVHHTSAEIFSKALTKVAFHYTIGLSATIKRKDGLSKIFLWYLGPVVYESEKRQEKAIVTLINYVDPDSEDYNEVPTAFNGKPNLPKMINTICSHQPRNDMIVTTIRDILSTEPARKILILSDRRNHLTDLSNQLTIAGYDTGVYMGGMKSSVLTDNNKKQILLATFAIASEGYDQPGLDTLILASPKSDVVQSVGRILRDKESDRKHVPLIVDIVDSHDNLKNQAQKRMQYYKQCQWLQPKSEPTPKCLFK